MSDDPRYPCSMPKTAPVGHGAATSHPGSSVGAKPDNWAHRTAQMKCAGCMWYVEKRPPLGRCRRRAPTLGGWPAVYESDWCGDHKIDEGRLA